MKKNKGFTLVEIIVTFSLVSAISFLLFQLILSLKNLYTTSDFKTALLIDQGNMTRRINSDLFSMEFNNLEECGELQTTGSKLCYIFTLTDTTSGESVDGATVSKKLEVFDDKIVYDGFTMDFSATKSTLGTISTSLSYADDISMHFDSILKIDIPITNKMVSGDYGLHIVLQYNSLTSEVAEDVLGDTNKIEVVNTSLKDIITDKVTTSGDGLYTINKNSWSAYENMPRYVFRGSNPSNYVIFYQKCYRIVAITQFSNNDLTTAGIKMIYDGDASDGVCTASSTGGNIGTELWGITSSGNSWYNSSSNSYLNKVILPNWVDNQSAIKVRLSTTVGSYVGAVSSSGTSTLTLINEELTNQGSTSLPSRNIYSDVGRTAYLLSPSDYVMASSSSKCTSISAATGGSCSSYLTKGYSYWTLNPVDGTTDKVWVVGSNGSLTQSLVSQSGIYVRPVIYLKGNTKFSGSGTASDPYVVR
jgi:hypothetical protein